MNAIIANHRNQKKFYSINLCRPRDVPIHTCEYCCALVIKSINLKSNEPIWPLKELGYEAIVFENRNIKSLAMEREQLTGCTKYGTRAGTTDITAAVSNSAY